MSIWLPSRKIRLVVYPRNRCTWPVASWWAKTCLPEHQVRLAHGQWNRGVEKREGQQLVFLENKYHLTCQLLFTRKSSYQKKTREILGKRRRGGGYVPSRPKEIKITCISAVTSDNCPGCLTKVYCIVLYCPINLYLTFTPVCELYFEVWCFENLD